MYILYIHSCDRGFTALIILTRMNGLTLKNGTLKLFLTIYFYE